MNIIKFYPFNEDTMEAVEPPRPASKFLPEWYKRQPAMVDNDGMKYGQPGATVKKCMPVFDVMTAGYIISAPCDIYIDSTDPERLTWSVPNAFAHLKSDMFASHAREQYSEYPLDSTYHHKTLLRVWPFWAIGTSKGYSCIFAQPFHSDDSPLYAVSGLVDTDSFVTEGHLSFIVKKNFKGTIKQGTPLVQVIPFKRESWSSQVVSLQEAQKVFNKQMFKLRSTFINAYKDKFRFKKEYK